MSRTKGKVAVVFTGVYFTGFLFLLVKSLNKPSFKELKIAQPSIIDVEIPQWNNLGSLWEKGDFVIGDVIFDNGQAAEFMSLKPKVFTIVEEGGAAAIKVTHYEAWALIIEGENLAKLREQFHNWKAFDLLRPIEIQTDTMTFSHLPSEQMFTVRIRNLHRGLTY